MRKSRTATATLTGLIGLVAFFGLASPADAGTNFNSKVAVTTTTVPTGGLVIVNPKKPADPQPHDMDIALPPAPPAPPAPPKGDFDISAAGGQAVVDPTGGNDPCAPVASCPTDGECTPGSSVDPDCVPDPCNKPGGPTCPPPDCDDEPTPQFVVVDPPDDCPPPCEEQGPQTDVGRANIPTDPCPGDDPCQDQGEAHAARLRGEDADPCDDCVDQDDRPQAPRSSDDDCCVDQDRPTPPRAGDGSSTRPGGDRPGGEDCGGTTGGTTGGSDGRLPHTGAELATYGLAGLALTGLGFGLKRLGRLFA
jgi:hypothetical protein